MSRSSSRPAPPRVRRRSRSSRAASRSTRATGSRRLVLTPDDGSEEIAYPITKRSRLLISDGDHVEVGTQLVAGCGRPEEGPAHPRPACHAEAPGRRGAGGLPLAGCGHPRQAHRGHRAADAAPRDGPRLRRHRPAARRARRAWPLRGREPRGGRRGRPAGVGSSGAHGHHEGVARDGLVAVGGLLPGDHPGAHRGRDVAVAPTRCSASRRTSSSASSSRPGTGLPRYGNVAVEPTEEAKAELYPTFGYDEIDFPPSASAPARRSRSRTSTSATSADRRRLDAAPEGVPVTVGPRRARTGSGAPSAFVQAWLVEPCACASPL